MLKIPGKVTCTRIGQYPILEKIGKGGSGTVYRCQDPITGQPLAIKVLCGEVVSDPKLRMRFAQECQVSRALNHPNIVRVLDFGLDGSKPYLVMEFVDGESLGQRLERDGRIPETEAVRLITQVGQALHWAHQRRLIHRDVKPDNILITATGKAKLTDLGLVKNLESDFNLTQTMSCLGTPNFMALEQFEDAKKADAFCDQYSLAATLYMVVTGEIPFRTHSAHAVGAIYKKKLTNQLTPPRQLVPELSERLERAILKAMHLDRDQRHATVQDFIEALANEPLSDPSPEPSADPEPSPEDPKADDTDQEPRIKPRYDSQRVTSCLPLQKEEEPWLGQVVNISETGMCLEINRRFERGAILTVVLESELASAAPWSCA